MKDDESKLEQGMKVFVEGSKVKEVARRSKKQQGKKNKLGFWFD